MTEKQYKECQCIIHAASTAAGASVKGKNLKSNEVAMLEAQKSMIIALGRVFNIKLTESVAEAMALIMIKK